MQKHQDATLALKLGGTDCQLRFADIMESSPSKTPRYPSTVRRHSEQAVDPRPPALTVAQDRPISSLALHGSSPMTCLSVLFHQGGIDIPSFRRVEGTIFRVPIERCEGALPYRLLPGRMGIKRFFMIYESSLQTCSEISLLISAHDRRLWETYRIC